MGKSSFRKKEFLVRPFLSPDNYRDGEDKGEGAVRRKFYAVHAFDCAIGR